MKENRQLEVELATVTEKSLAHRGKATVETQPPISLRDEPCVSYEQNEDSNYTKYNSQEKVKEEEASEENRRMKEEIESYKKELSKYIQENIELKERIKKGRTEQ
eukprot:TRINITY_DN5008_c0_g1_i6.p1 TRINITY_DN5008_c0_g1~~TRINITY_DN5008_c0_g1_i6.p1  ORF type:complete len:105 (-),score=45.56 TRINITY_DN5008_c0_g1_i6:316-630(-)